MIAPAALTDDAVVAAEAMVSLAGRGPKLVAAKIATQIAAVASAIKGGEKKNFCFMMMGR
jgi:hypothetical protein